MKETRQKISEAKKGKKVSTETRQKMSEAKRDLYLGEDNPNAKISLDKVIQIKKLLRNNTETLVIMAMKFGVSKNIIWQIKNNKTWKHIII